jgi:hypothetical protein
MTPPLHYWVIFPIMEIELRGAKFRPGGEVFKKPLASAPECLFHPQIEDIINTPPEQGRIYRE